MSVPRFFVPDLNQSMLTGDQAYHCQRVLRLENGDGLRIFDGRGNEAECRVAKLSPSAVHLETLKRTHTDPLPCRITLAQAVPKKNMDWIVEKATELGVSEIVPLISERVVARPDAGKLTRWRNIALEACKQCGNNWLPEIHSPRIFADFLAAPGQHDLNLIASLRSDAVPLRAVLSTVAINSLHAVLLLIGPEGDFTATEYDMAHAAGCRPLSLGPLVLRAETASVAALSIIRYEIVSVSTQPTV